MSDIPGFISGWRSEPNYVRDQIAEREAAGHLVTSAAFCASKPNLAGTWKAMKAAGCTGIFLRDFEPRLLSGNYRRPCFQKFGTCTSRGMFRGCQTSLDASILASVSLMKPVNLTFAPIYSLSRVEVGKNRCGSGDGAILADSARAVHDYGVATNDLFPGTSEDDIEKMAVKFAAPGAKTPSSWIAACKGHTCTTFWPDTLDMIFDCIASRYAVPYANGYITAKPNSNGLSRLGSQGGHARCFVGVYVDENGEDQLESSESWGRYPAGDPHVEDSTMPIGDMPRITIRYAGGTHELAPGDVGVDAKQFWQAIQDGGEAWAVSAPNYEADSVSEAA
jgi:hypothetical protein